MPFFGRIQNEVGVYNHAVRIKRTSVIGDGVGVTTLVDDIVYRYGIFAHHTPAFAGLWYLYHVKLSLELGFGLDECP